MYVKQFEEFIASHFLDWAEHNIVAGFRYQFQSPNIDNSTQLYHAFVNPSFAKGVINVEGHSLAYLTCGNVKLIPVIQNEGEGIGYTENFISFLRDKVSDQNGEFLNSALFIIHNSLLDTLVNSAQDLTAEDSVFDPAFIKASLSELIDEKDAPEGKEVSKILLDYQFDLILEDKGSMFGFSSLYTAISDGNIRFNEIGLLNDPAILAMSGQEEQVRKRLDKNRELYDQIQDVLEHYPDQLEDNLPDLGEAFIKKNFRQEDPDAWKLTTYDEFRKEQDNNREQNLEISSESSATSRLIVRTKGESKSVQKERHMLLVVDENRDDFDLTIEFVGGKVTKSEIRVTDKCKEISYANNVVLTGGSVNTSLVVTGKVREMPRFFMISLDRKKTSEKFKFKCLVVKSGQFNTEAIENSFVVNPQKQLVTLQTQDTELDISVSDLQSKVNLETVGQRFSVLEHGVVDFALLSNEVDRILFDVVNGGAKLTFEVEGAAPTEVLTLPLIFDQSRGAKLFSDSLVGVFRRTKRRVYIENKEVKGQTQAIGLLDLEASLIDHDLLYSNDKTEKEISLSEVNDVAPNLAESYRLLYEYYVKNKTLPSLCGWGNEYRALVKQVVSAYHEYLSLIPHKRYLEDEQKLVLQIGMMHHEGDEFISPVHPLVLSYYLNLVEYVIADASNSFHDLPKVTLDRLNPQGLLPFVFDAEHSFSYVKVHEHNCFWMHCVPHKDTNYSYVTKLVKDKIDEFTEAFSSLFGKSKGIDARSTLIINSVNNYENHELFLGVVEHVIKHKNKTVNIHVNVYDDSLIQNEFDRFSDMSSYDQIKQSYGLNKGKAKDHADTIVDLLRTRVTYSKFTHDESDQQAYAHLTFFRNNQKVKVIDVNPEDKLSGITCHGLINGEASASEQGNYITGFGLKNTDFKGLLHVEIAEMLGRLIRPSRESAIEYRDSSAIALAVDDRFKTQLERSYDSAIWTSIIDPKVTLDFFENSQDMLLIHYSDQYTSSASYDAITVTRQTDLYDKVLEKEEGGLIGEFNAFNGEWLLKMITDPPLIRKERKGILAAYKLVSCLLANSDITWVPMSAAEMVRVSGNIGLKMSESEFSRNVQGYKSGAISDDVLFVGFKDQKLYLLPLEVKTGVSYDVKKAIKQAQELSRYLSEELLSGDGFSRKLYRGLFIRQALMQIDKYELYSIYPEGYFSQFVDNKEWWLQGDYELAGIADYPRGFVVANLQDDKCLETNVEEVEGILKIEVPYSFLPKTISTPLKTLLLDTHLTAAAQVPEKYFLTHSEACEVVQNVDHQEISDIVKEVVDEEHQEIEENIEVESVQKIEPTESLKVLVGHEVKHDEPVYWEPTNTAKFMNTNSGIIGTMGTGKTQCTKSVVTQLYRNQHLNIDAKPIGLLIFDYKSDYVDDKFLSVTGGKKYNLHKLPYNPLSLFGDTPMLPVHTARGFSETMGKAFGLGQKQQLKLRKLISEAYELAGISKSDQSTWSKPAPTIADVWSLFIDQEKVEEDSLYAALESLYELEIFEDDISKCTSLYQLIDGIRVIELAGYPPQIQNLVVALTLDLFYSQMQKQGKPEVRGDFRQVTKMILVDEADNFMSQDFPSLRKVLKEGREYGVGVILSTQDITHFKTKENDYSAYILSWVIHRVSQIKNQDIKSLFNKDDKAEQEYLMKTIRELDKHYSLYIDGDKKVSKIKDKAFWELIV
ncbi:DNA phosphorothioation-dependent restriction protein DptH [Oleiphilus sp. HI0117]|uniref:DNA phosphorothioation-dependent restriction protein DptH n=2 Tax=unclassified Oleiphilus TaxID=2631174 RepID=UPI0007C21CC9|nr:DNA phosphorothioation-dependent restriction protein DptH [Oleiphilus sp. HI0117]KZZ36863.1 DNA phosphorothioation-dependent restriction protein DptH [Oleiphilus sp. HI0117]